MFFVAWLRGQRRGRSTRTRIDYLNDFECLQQQQQQQQGMGMGILTQVEHEQDGDETEEEDVCGRMPWLGFRVYSSGYIAGL